MTERWPIGVPAIVRDRDCGVDEVLDESVLLVLFREGRRGYMLAIAGDRDEPLRYRLWDARLKVRRVITVGDELIVRTRCDELGGKSFRLRYQLWDTVVHEVVADGASVQVLVDPAGKDLPIPSWMRERVTALEGREFPRPS